MSLPISGGEDPELSVLMVTHGSWPLTERALQAVVRHTDIPFEIIVVDNASPDETPSRLAAMPHLRVVLNQQNRGFGAATNQAAAKARGRYLLLLNSDAFVQDGWLPPMRDALQRPGVGAVVPCLLNEDGSLQDAGGLLACDGTVRIYGDGDDPAGRHYRFSRLLDYGSAACLLMRRSTFTSLGGFDSAFEPAYYEDSDLGFRLSRHGLSVLYEPRTAVTHVRYGSGSAELAVQLSERNRHRFVERWHADLVGRPRTFAGATEQAEIAARDVAATPRLLLCSVDETPGVRGLVEMLLTLWPSGRLTWASGSTAGDCWLGRGVELLDEPDWTWLDRRLFHYDAVFVAAAEDERLAGALLRTQPQAPKIAFSDLRGWPDLSPGALHSAVVVGGVAPDVRPRRS